MANAQPAGVDKTPAKRGRYPLIIGVADGSIMPAIITDHMVQMRMASWPVQAEVIGIANGDPMSCIRALRNTR